MPSCESSFPCQLLIARHHSFSTSIPCDRVCPVLKPFMSDLTMTNTDHDQQPWSALSPILPWSSLPPKKLILSAISLKVANFRHFSPRSRSRPGLYLSSFCFLYFLAAAQIQKFFLWTPVKNTLGKEPENLMCLTALSAQACGYVEAS